MPRETEMPAELAQAIAENPVAQSADRLDALNTMVAKMRDLQTIKAMVETQLESVTKELNELRFTKLPKLFDEAGVSSITLEGGGDTPAVKATAKPWIVANIAASWDEAKRKRAFEYLDSIGHGDLIKTGVGVDFTRDRRADAKALADRLEADGFNTKVVESVHNQTLSAWLREQIDSGEMPDLEVIGGSVGRTVDLKPVK